MAIRERLVYAIDVVTDGANKGLANFRQSVSQAEGVTGKFKAGASSAFTSVQANAGALALAGGAALATFGAKAVGAFQETALEAGKFSDATGLAVEDASRWIEVAGDVGVSAETMQGAFVKLNKAIGSGSPELEKYGIGLITAADGTADVNQTMLTAIQRIGAIKDPTERAAAAQAAFGRSYAEAAEIIFDNADNVKKKLAEVSDAKVIDAAEVEKARKFRQAMDDLKDVAEDLTITVGENLVPVLTDLAESLSDVAETADDLKIPELLKFGTENTALHRVRQLGGEIAGWFGDGGEAAKAVEYSTQAAEQYVESLEQMHQSASEAAAIEADHADTLKKSGDQAQRYIDFLVGKGIDAQNEMNAATDRARRSHKLLADAIRDQTDAVLDGLGSLHDYADATNDLDDAVNDLRTVLQETPDDWNAVEEAQRGARDQALSTAEAYAASAGAQENSTAKALLMIAELERQKGIYPELVGVIQGYIDELNRIPAVKTTTVMLNGAGRAYTKQTVGAGGRLVAGAEGAIVTQPTGALIGEAGPEAVIPLNKMPGASPLPGGLGGGGDVHIHATIYANDSESVFDKLAREVRAKGPGPVRRALGID